MTILETKNLCFSYRDGDKKRVILDHVSVSFEKGTFYTILGTSGSGKTTFLSLISTLEKNQQGEIYFEGKNLKEMNESEYRSKNISIIFQDYNLIPYLTSYQNVLLAMDISQTKEKDANQYLKRVGIDEEMSKRKVTHLSGGEQQRVAIARALSTNAKIIMADEPTGNLDKKTGASIIEILKKLAHEDDKCVIVVSHSHDVAKQSDHILLLDSEIHNFVEIRHEDL